MMYIILMKNKTQYKYSVTNKIHPDPRLVSEVGLYTIFGNSMYHVIAVIADKGEYENSWCTVTRKIRNNNDKDLQTFQR
jgi:hypothetical protein